MSGPERDGSARPAASARSSALTRLRRVAVIAVIVSLSLTAVIGIVTLLSGDFGDVQGRVLATTSLVGAFSVLALCHLAVAGRPVRAVGFVGLAATTIALVLGLVLVWSDGAAGWDGFRWLLVFTIVAVSFAHANLLLLLAGRRQPAIRVILAGTLAAIALVALGLLVPILTDGDIPGSAGDTYWRVFGVVAILDALGTIVLPVLAAVLRSAGGGAPVADRTGPIQLPAELDQRVRAAAVARGIPPEQVLAEIVAEQLPA